MKTSPEILARQIETLMELRQAWNRADSPTTAKPATAEALPPADPALAGVPAMPYGRLGEEVASSSWSA